jgi:hypothetical protein
MNSNRIEAIIFGAAIGVAILRYFNMSEEDKKDFMNRLKDRVSTLLEDTEGTIGKVKEHFEQIDSKDEWVDKALILKKLLTTLFGTNGKLLTA